MWHYQRWKGTKKFTKRLPGYGDLSYAERRAKLKLKTLKLKRIWSQVRMSKISYKICDVLLNYSNSFRRQLFIRTQCINSSFTCLLVTTVMLLWLTPELRGSRVEVRIRMIFGTPSRAPLFGVNCDCRACWSASCMFEEPRLPGWYCKLRITVLSWLLFWPCRKYRHTSLPKPFNIVAAAPTGVDTLGHFIFP